MAADETIPQLAGGFIAFDLSPHTTDAKGARGIYFPAMTHEDADVPGYRASMLGS
jgi:hypothetical protein